MTALYELTEEIKTLQDMVLDGEFSLDDISDTLTALTGEFEEKCVNVAKVINGIKYNADAIDQEIKRLQDRKKRINSKCDGLKEYLMLNMEKNDTKKIEWPCFTISIRKGSPVVSVHDEKLIPDEFMIVKTDIKPDKAAIKKAFKDLEEDEEIPGCNVVTGAPSIQIK